MNRGRFPEKKSVGILIDPDKSIGVSLDRILHSAEESKVDYILVGGSITFSSIEKIINYIREKCTIPVVLFPGNLLQLSRNADAILLLSLISGRNPELLIGNHVLAAPFLKDIREKLIPAGYILINCGSKTSVEYMSQTESIPADKHDIVIATALAGEMLGLKVIYLEGGSGAQTPVPGEIIKKVKDNISIPLIVGGGIREPEQIEKAYTAGADLIVLGNGVENDLRLLKEACLIRDKLRK